MDNIVLTGFTGIDYQMKGLRGSELIFIGARPGIGKSSFALNIARNVTDCQNIPTVFYSLEMSKEQVLNLIKNMKWENKTEFIIDDKPALSIDELVIRSKRYRDEFGIGLIIIDYLQLLRDEGIESRQQEMSSITWKLKELACDIAIPIIVISHISHAIDNRANHKPTIFDLRYLGAIEQDFDTIMLMYRDDYYNSDSERKGITEISVPKFTWRSIADVELAYIHDMNLYANLLDHNGHKVEISHPAMEHKDLSKKIPSLGYIEFEKNILKTYLEHGYDLYDETFVSTGKGKTRKYSFGKVKSGVFRGCDVEIKAVQSDSEELRIELLRNGKYDSYESALDRIKERLDRRQF